MKGIQRTHVSCGAAGGRGGGVCSVLYGAWWQEKGAGSRGAARQSGVGHMHTRISLPPRGCLTVNTCGSLTNHKQQTTHPANTHTHTNTHTDTRMQTVAGNLVA